MLLLAGLLLHVRIRAVECDFDQGEVGWELGGNVMRQGEVRIGRESD